MERHRELLRLMSELLEYPNVELKDRVRRCRELLAEVRPEAAAALDEFRAYVNGEPFGRLEEVYSATFDLKPVCYPYAGFHLFGEQDTRRSELMVKLRESYREAGFDAGNELPDYVPVLLRFLAHTEDEDLQRDLSSLVLSPVLQKMAEALEAKHNPYGKAVSAALSLMTEM